MRPFPFVSIAAVFLVFSVSGGLAGTARAAGPGVHGRVFELSEDGRVLGPLADAKVEFVDESGQTAQAPRSNARGYYRTDLIPGRYRFRVSRDGFRTQDSDRGLLINRSEGYVTQSFGLVRGESRPAAESPDTPQELGTLVGRVVERDSQGQFQPIGGARITLRRGGEVKTRVIFARKHDSDDGPTGTFQVRLPAAKWAAAVAAPGFERLVEPEPIIVGVQEQAKHVFVLKRSTRPAVGNEGIRGSVVVAGPEGKVKPPGEIEVLIHALKAAGPHGRQIKLAGPGPFSQDLPEGLYRLVARAPGYRPAYTHPLLVLRGSYTGVKLTLEPEPSEEPPAPPKPAGLIVTVLGEAGVAKARPLPDATVLIRVGAGPMRRETTNSAGEVRTKLDSADGPQSLTVAARKDGYSPDGVREQIQAGEERRVTIVLKREPPIGMNPGGPDTGQPTQTGGTTTQGGPSVVQRDPNTPPVSTTTLSGYVVYRDANGKLFGVSDTRLSFTSGPRAAGATAVSEYRGRFSLELPVGSYTVVADPPAGYQGARQSIEVRADGKAQYVYIVRLAPPKPSTATLEVWVSEDEPYRGVTGVRSRIRPAQGATVQITSQNGGGSRSEQTSSEGGASFNVLLGQYRVRASKPGYYDAEATAVVDGDGTRLGLRLRPMSAPDHGSPPLPDPGPGSTPGGGFDPPPLPANGSLDFVVHDAKDRRNILPLARVDVVGSNGRYNARFTPRSRTHHADVAPGVYRVRVAHLGYHTEELVVKVQSGGRDTQYVALRPVKIDWPPPGWPGSGGSPSGGGSPGTGSSSSGGPSGTGQLPPPTKLAPVEIRVMVDYGGEFGPGPLDRASVTISRGGKTLARGVTGKDGIYRVSLPQGTGYQLKVSADPKRRLNSPTSTFTLGRSYSTTITLRAAGNTDPPKVLGPVLNSQGSTSNSARPNVHSLRRATSAVRTTINRSPSIPF